MPINLKAAYTTDPELESSGVWIDIPGGKLLIARWMNPIHKAALDRLREPFSAMLAVGGNLTPAQVEASNITAGAEGILLGWEGVIDDDEKPVPYSRAKAAEFLGLKDLRDRVFSEAMAMENYRKAKAKAIVGNSGPLSAGEQNGEAKSPSSSTKRQTAA